MLQKWSTVGVVLLFITVSVAPIFQVNVVKASSDNELIEVTSEACGISGYGNTTVKLTKQQYSDLEQYLVEFRAKLNQTTTREETIPLFKDVVVELNKYGLLPKGMSVESIQRLVINDIMVFSLMQNKFEERRYETENIENRMCLVAGSTYSTSFFPWRSYFRDMIIKGIVIPIVIFELFIYLITFFFPVLDPLINLAINLDILAEFFLECGNLFLRLLNPFVMLSNGFINGYGWILTIGKLGKQTITSSNGTLVGSLLHRLDSTLGIIGFSGLRLTFFRWAGTLPEVYLERLNTFYLGSALAVNVENRY